MFKAMLLKEFILLLRDKYALAALFIMPSIFILIMSIALKDTFGSDRALLSYAVIDQDNTAESAKLRTFLLSNGRLKEHKAPITNTAQRQEALNGKLHFIVSIPPGFAQNLDTEQSASLLQLDVASDVKQEMLTLVQAELVIDIIRMRMEKIQEELAPFLPEVAQKLEAMKSNRDNLIQVRFNAMGINKKPTSTQQSVPSWIVFGMFFVIIPMSTVFISEHKQNTLMRMSAMNISVPVLFAGKLAPYIIINQIQVWLMIGVGIFLVPLFGADALTLGDSISGLFMVSLGLSLAAIGTSILIAVTADTVEQATTIGGIINILMGAIGGVMVPKFYMSQSMQQLTNISPMSWGLEGFLDIFLRGQGAGAVITESLTLAGFGAGLLLAAGMILNAKMKRGI
ncbi:MAG: ABC transporter permease [Proteobacteria bacterium]|nr:ABC transporter permease [Desulfocapsa sp.]MBU3943732.1 ABC transporter permease [Pseudomonadota bacterium]MCG2744825.1 ABC transporter permease [Desulfobacteraceae bacterium]MBU3983214.1 ABC transporter permease [Pseudomonadota bacterium]MBU4029267.1 ABC transporter permease [Pseudomonadota bacterium]